MPLLKFENKGKLEDSYKLLEEIGQGGFGTVYTALHKPSGDIRAVKIVNRRKEKPSPEILLLKELVLKLIIHRTTRILWSSTRHLKRRNTFI